MATLTHNGGGDVTIDDVLTLTGEDIEGMAIDCFDGQTELTDEQVERIGDLVCGYVDESEVENVINDAVYDILNRAVMRAAERAAEGE